MTLLLPSGALLTLYASTACTLQAMLPAPDDAKNPEHKPDLSDRMMALVVVAVGLLAIAAVLYF